MTLVYNEIQVHNSLRESIILFAADSRLSTAKKDYSKQAKLFKIEYLRGGLSYFGLSRVYPMGRERVLSDYLRSFIRNHNHLRDLRHFAKVLRDDLDRVVPRNILANTYSGFHLAGYSPEGYPDFVYFSNIGSGANFQYSDLQPHYFEPESHFLDRDARDAGWDGADPLSIQFKGRIYRNGDIYPHYIAWNKLDEIFDILFQHFNFDRLNSVYDYERYVHTKLSIIAYIYKRHAKEKVVGTPFTVFSYNTLQS